MKQIIPSYLKPEIKLLDIGQSWSDEIFINRLLRDAAKVMPPVESKDEICGMPVIAAPLLPDGILAVMYARRSDGENPASVFFVDPEKLPKPSPSKAN